MSTGDDGINLSSVGEIPGGELFQNTINEFNKKAAGATLNLFKRVLGTVTEPFFRTGLGERYYSRDTHACGIALWIFGTLLAIPVPYYCSAGGPLFQIVGSEQLAELFKNRLLPCITGLLMVVGQAVLGADNLRKAFAARNEGRPLHTRSRGVPRFPNELLVFVGMESILLLFNIPVGVLFLVGYLMNWKLKADQNAAIMSRYLDTIDKELENQYLRDAALDTCPTELTYLYKPLSKDLNPQVRNDIAASLVGKPVKGIAKARQGKSSEQSAGATSTPRTTTYVPTISPGEAPPSKIERPARKPFTFPRLSLGRSVRRGFLVFLALISLVWAAIAFWPATTRSIETKTGPQGDGREQTPVNATSGLAENAKPSAALPDVVKPVSAIVPSTPPRMQEALAPATPAPHEDSSKIQAALEAQSREARRKLLEELNSALTNQIAQCSKFKEDCDARFAANTNRIEQLQRSYKTAYKETNERFWAESQVSYQAQQVALNGFQATLKSYSSKPQYDLQRFQSELQAGFIELEKTRNLAFTNWDLLDIKIAQAPKKKGFLFFK